MFWYKHEVRRFFVPLQLLTRLVFHRHIAVWLPFLTVRTRFFSINISLEPRREGGGGERESAARRFIQD